MTDKSGWRRLMVLAAAAGLLALLFLAAAGPPPDPGTPPPQLIVDSSVAGDFEALAKDTWAKFIAVFQARSGCFGDVQLRVALRLESRAVYDPTTATITVRVPATAALLREALIHEFAHHLEFQCPAHTSLRPRFLAAQGLPPTTPWRLDDSPASTPASAWAGIPSEQAAEAAVELVLGRRQVPTGVKLKPGAVQVLAAWASGQ